MHELPGAVHACQLLLRQRRTLIASHLSHCAAMLGADDGAGGADPAARRCSWAHPAARGCPWSSASRLSIAVELVANPSLVLMDEPTTGACASRLHTHWCLPAMTPAWTSFKQAPCVMLVCPCQVWIIPGVSDQSYHVRGGAAMNACSAESYRAADDSAFTTGDPLSFQPDTAMSARSSAGCSCVRRVDSSHQNVSASWGQAWTRCAAAIVMRVVRQHRGHRGGPSPAPCTSPPSTSSRCELQPLNGA